MKPSSRPAIARTVMRLLLAATILPAGAAQADSRPAVAKTSILLFERTLSFRLPSGFVEVINNNNGTNILIEYVPRGETVANWTQMVTIQAYRGLGTSPRSTAHIAQQAFYPAACKIGPIYHDGGEQAWVNGIKRTIIANGCASLPAGAYPKALKGAGEQDFIYIFRDADTIYTLNYAVRGKSFAGKAPPVGVANGATVLQQMFGDVQL